MIRRAGLAICALWILCAVGPTGDGRRATGEAFAATLYDQAVVTLLRERFTRADVSYIPIKLGKTTSYAFVTVLLRSDSSVTEMPLCFAQASCANGLSTLMP